MYAELLHKLRRREFADLTPALRENLLNFYSNSTDDTVRRKRKRWREVLRDLDELKTARTVPEPEPHPVMVASRPLP
jgi:hypothetical protein